MTYDEQLAQIMYFTARIRQKAENFAKAADSPHYQELHDIIRDLRDTEQTIPDKYLKETKEPLRD